MAGDQSTSRGTKRTKTCAPIPTIILSIQSQIGEKDYFKLGVNTTIKELLKAYSNEKQLEYRCVSFIFNNKRLAPKKTIHELGLKDGDQIDAMLTQSGGGPSTNV